MVTFDAFFQILLKVGMPIFLVYLGYLQATLHKLQNKIDEVRDGLSEFRERAANTYATVTALTLLEDKITRKLDRIDDKLTKILESR